MLTSLFSTSVSPEFVENLAQTGAAISESDGIKLAHLVKSPRVGFNVRFQAAGLLKNCPHRSVAEILANAVSILDDETRVLAAHALSGTEFPFARDVLIDAIGLAYNAPLRLAMVAAESLRPVSEEGEILRLRKILEERGGIWVGTPANAVCAALIGTSSKLGLDILLDLTLKPFADFDHTPGRAIHFESHRWGNSAAAEALSKTGIPNEVLERLIEASKEDNPARWYAIKALVGRVEPNAQNRLRELATEDPNTEVRSLAAAGLIVERRI